MKPLFFDKRIHEEVINLAGNMLDSDHGVPKIFKIYICNKANDIFKVWLEFRIALFIFVYHICIALAIWTNLVLPKRYTAWKVSKYGFFFWSVFCHICTEYGEILRISPYSVRMRENTDQKKLRVWTLFTQWVLKKTLLSEKNEMWKSK